MQFVPPGRGQLLVGHLQQRCDWTEDLPNGNVMTLNVDDSVLTAGSVFKDDVRSSLPHVEVMTRAEYRYLGVFIDEERIVGLKVCPKVFLRVGYSVFVFLQISDEDELRISSFDVHTLC